MLFFINVGIFFFQKYLCKRVLTSVKKQAYTLKNVGYQAKRKLTILK